MELTQRLKLETIAGVLNKFAEENNMDVVYRVVELYHDLQETMEFETILAATTGGAFTVLSEKHLSDIKEGVFTIKNLADLVQKQEVKFNWKGVLYWNIIIDKTMILLFIQEKH